MRLKFLLQTMAKRGSATPQKRAPPGHKGKPRRTRPDADAAPVVTPGVNKLKSSIRQAKRLLAKESLAPGVRIEAERRLAALERDLHAQQHAAKERNLASRYHKIKFFERQKLHRRIRQLRRALHGDVKEKHAKRARKQLHEARTLLNYVLHFPKDQRYVALYAGAHAEPVPPSSDAADKTHRRAAEFLDEVRAAMKRGDMSLEPDLELAEREARQRVERLQRAKTAKPKRSERSGRHEAEGEEAEDDEDGVDLEDDEDEDESEGDEDDEEAGVDEDEDKMDAAPAKRQKLSQQPTSPMPASRSSRAPEAKPKPSTPSAPSVQEDEFFAFD